MITDVLRVSTLTAFPVSSETSPIKAPQPFIANWTWRALHELCLHPGEVASCKQGNDVYFHGGDCLAEGTDARGAMWCNRHATIEWYTHRATALSQQKEPTLPSWQTEEERERKDKEERVLGGRLNKYRGINGVSGERKEWTEGK